LINKLPWVDFGFNDLLPPLTLKEARRYVKIRKNFFDIENTEDKQRIFVAARKLSASMNEFYGGEDVMHTVSGLEGLLVKSKTEPSHRFAENIALLLETDKIVRKKIYESMKSAYVLRSDVAHGTAVADYFDSIISPINYESSLDKNKKKKIPKMNALQELRPILRERLHQAILMCIDKQTTNFDWNSSIIGTRIDPKPICQGKKPKP
jgi:hypothetical protein